jgi:hypothetical protein
MNRYWLVLIWPVLAALPAAVGQTFDSGSDGSDGALDLSGQSGVVIFDPVAEGLDSDRDNVFHFTTITVPAGVTLRMRGLELQFAPVYWLASGAVAIDGIVDLSGEGGHDLQLGNRRPSMPGPGGFPGGVGATADSPAQPGLGPGGGPVNRSASHGPGSTATCPIPPPYGNLLLIPLTGGSGGGGKTGGSGGGAGGGALLIASSASIRVDGSLRANGGDNGVSSRHCSVGAGGGIRLLTPRLIGNGLITADHGRRFGGDNTFGGEGRIRIETLQNEFTGSIAGVSRIATLSPNALILPQSLAIPSIRVTQIAGVDVPDVPSGDFLDPDIVIDAGVPVDITVEARNIPTDANLTLDLYPETGPDVTLEPQLIGGDEASSAWAGSATFPHGFSRTFMHATWGP